MTLIIHRSKVSGSKTDPSGILPHENGFANSEASKPSNDVASEHLKSAVVPPIFENENGFANSEASKPSNDVASEHLKSAVVLPFKSAVGQSHEIYFSKTMNASNDVASEHLKSAVVYSHENENEFAKNEINPPAEAAITSGIETICSSQNENKPTALLYPLPVSKALKRLRDTLHSYRKDCLSDNQILKLLKVDYPTEYKRTYKAWRCKPSNAKKELIPLTKLTFLEFIWEVGFKPSSKHHIHRPIDSKGYIHGNMVWNTVKQNMRSKQSLKKHVEWCMKDQGKSRATIYRYLNQIKQISIREEHVYTPTQPCKADHTYRDLLITALFSTFYPDTAIVNPSPNHSDKAKVSKLLQSYTYYFLIDNIQGIYTNWCRLQLPHGVSKSPNLNQFFHHSVDIIYSYQRFIKREQEHKAYTDKVTKPLCAPNPTKLAKKKYVMTKEEQIQYTLALISGNDELVDFYLAKEQDYIS